jgi:hypothetical protein
LLHGPWAAAARWLGGSAKKKAIDTAERMAAKTAAKSTVFEVKQRAAAEAQTIADQLKVEEQFRRSVEAARKAEAAKRGMAEAADARSGIKVENQWANANPVVASSTASNLEQDLIKAGVAPRVAREMTTAKAGGVPASDVTGRVEGASRRAVADGVGKSSVPKTDDLLEGDFIDPKHVSVVPPAGKPSPDDFDLGAYEHAVSPEDLEIIAYRNANGAARAAKKYGKTEDEIRLITGDKGTEGLREAGGIPQKYIDQMNETLDAMQARNAAPSEYRAWAQRANNEKARLQAEGMLRGRRIKF